MIRISLRVRRIRVRVRLRLTVMIRAGISGFTPGFTWALMSGRGLGRGRVSTYMGVGGLALTRGLVGMRTGVGGY